MSTKQFDVVVIGAGPGGYIAAIRAAQLGFSVACVDEWSNAKGGAAPGGTCTNVGCIPSKALLQSSEHFEHAGHSFAEHGIDVAGLKLNLGQMLKRKDTVVKQNNDGILYLFKKNKIAFFHGFGSLRRVAKYEISVVAPQRNVGDQARHHRHRFQCTRNAGRAIRRETDFVDTGALAIDAVPAKLGVIARRDRLEMGSVCAAGFDVTILEGLQCCWARSTSRSPRKRQAVCQARPEDQPGLQDRTITPGKKDVSGIRRRQGRGSHRRVRQAIISIGRTPNTTAWPPTNRPATGRARLYRRRRRLQDQPANVWAVGEVVRGPMLRTGRRRRRCRGRAYRRTAWSYHFNTIPG